MGHKCKVPYCDGTRLGHELAKDFPEETARFHEGLSNALDRMIHREDYVMSENLRVDEEGPPEAYSCRCGGDSRHPRSPLCGS